MIRINLLPHRQIRRAERQKQFGLMALVTVAAGAAIVFMGSTIINAKKSNQDDRNSRLDGAIVKLDKEIEDIKSLKDQINSVLSRKQIVENLQTNRSQAVVVLDELSRQLPEGLFLKSIKQQAGNITLQGTADTNARVATLVRNLSVSNWMTSPNLVEIKSVVVNNIKQNDFTLNVSIKSNQPVTDESSSNKKIGVK